MPRNVEDTIGRIGALVDPVRRALYRCVAESPGDVSRDQAARAVRISRALAAFHLDKLVEHGLLEVSYRRLTKRRGPVAGRPAKLYHRSGLQLHVSLPSRDYELAARLFAGALVAAPPSVVARLRSTARRFGVSLGRDARRRDRRPMRRAAPPQRIDAALAELGYEPFRTPDGALRLRNCPFDALTRDHRALVCDANVSFLRGIVAGLRMTGVEPRLDPQPGTCCVAFQPVRRKAPARRSGR